MTILPNVIYQRFQAQWRLRQREGFSPSDEDDSDVLSADEYSELTQLARTYDACLDNYFFLGFVLSLIPNTAAYHARENFSLKLRSACNKLIASEQKAYDSMPSKNAYFWFQMKLKQAKLSGIFNLSHIYQFLFVVYMCYAPMSVTNSNNKWLSVFFTLPFVSALCEIENTQNGLKAVLRKQGKLLGCIRYLMNPFNVVLSLIRPCQNLLYCFIDLYSKPGPSSRARQFFKGIVSLAFGTVSFPICICGMILHGIYSFIYHFIIQPIHSVAASLLWNILTSNQRILVADTETILSLKKYHPSLRHDTVDYQMIANLLAFNGSNAETIPWTCISTDKAVTEANYGDLEKTNINGKQIAMRVSWFTFYKFHRVAALIGTAEEATIANHYQFEGIPGK